MPQIPISLGAGVFSFPKARLQLDFTASASIMSNLPLDGISVSTCELLNFTDSWARKSHDFHFCFTISFNGRSLGDYPPGRFMPAQFGQLLQNAQLWSQLHLLPSLTLPALEVESAPSSNNLFTLHLRDDINSNADPAFDTQCTGNRPFDPSNLQPPANIPAVVLQSVEVFLNFSTTSAEPRRPRKTFLDEDQAFHDLFCQDEAYADPSKDPLHKRPGILDHNSGKEVDDNKYLGRDEIDIDMALQPFPLSYVHIHNSKDSCADGRDSNMPAPEFFSRPDQMQNFQISNLGFSSALANDVVAGDPLQREQLQTLIPSMFCLTDVAFRNLICARPIRTAAGVRTAAETSLTRLADIAPLVFCPSYAQNVSERSRFIPSIARFMTAFLHISDSAHSKTQPGQLRRQNFQEMHRSLSDHDVGGQNYCCAIKETLEAHLWLTLLNGLRNPEAARRLKPVHVPLNDCEGLADIRQSGEMLEDALDQSASGEPGSQLNDEDNTVLEIPCLDYDEEDVCIDDFGSDISFGAYDAFLDAGSRDQSILDETVEEYGAAEDAGLTLPNAEENGDLLCDYILHQDDDPSSTINHSKFKSDYAWAHALDSNPLVAPAGIVSLFPVLDQGISVHPGHPTKPFSQSHLSQHDNAGPRFNFTNDVSPPSVGAADVVPHQVRHIRACLDGSELFTECLNASCLSCSAAEERDQSSLAYRKLTSRSINQSKPSHAEMIEAAPHRKRSSLTEVWSARMPFRSRSENRIKVTTDPSDELVMEMKDMSDSNINVHSNRRSSDTSGIDSGSDDMIDRAYSPERRFISPPESPNNKTLPSPLPSPFSRFANENSGEGAVDWLPARRYAFEIPRMEDEGMIAPEEFPTQLQVSPFPFSIKWRSATGTPTKKERTSRSSTDSQHNMTDLREDQAYGEDAEMLL